MIVPVFREAGNIENLVAGLEQSLSNADWEVVFVDDDSDDGTFNAVRQLARQNPRVRGLLRVHERGLSSAAIAGLLSTKADYLVVMDGDGQHDPADIPRLIEPLHDGWSDIVSAARDLSSVHASALSMPRRYMSRFANKLVSLVVGRNINDPMTGFFAIRSDAFDSVVRKLGNAGFKLLTDILIKAPDLRHKEVTFQFKPRHSGGSKLDMANVWEFSIYIVACLTRGLVPQRFVSFLAIGAIGLIVHFSILYGMLGFGASFPVSQAIAALTATGWNYWLNNQLTFRDRKLHGKSFLIGLFTYYIINSIGVIANVAVASKFHEEYAIALSVSAFAGIVIDTVWKFAMANALIWRKW